MNTCSVWLLKNIITMNNLPGMDVPLARRSALRSQSNRGTTPKPYELTGCWDMCLRTQRIYMVLGVSRNFQKLFTYCTNGIWNNTASMITVETILSKPRHAQSSTGSCDLTSRAGGCGGAP